MFSSMIKTSSIYFRVYHPLLWQSIRSRRRGFPRIDPELALYQDDELEEEPVAYLEERPDAPSRPKKLTPSLEKKLRKESLKKVILRRKQLKENLPKEPLLLTWAARAQIKHLHATEPSVWDVKTLARNFPVSEFAIYEIIRSKMIPYDKHDLEKIDRKARNNWLKLKEEAVAYLEGKEVDPMYRRLIEDNDRWSRIVNAAGIADLSVPQEYEIIKTMVGVAEQAKPVVRKRFSSILDNYRPNEDSSTGEVEVPQYIGIDDVEVKSFLEDIVKLRGDEGRYFQNIDKSSESNIVESNYGYLNNISRHKNVSDRKVTSVLSNDMKDFISGQMGKNQRPTPGTLKHDISDFQTEESDNQLQQKRIDKTVPNNTWFVEKNDRKSYEASVNDKIPEPRIHKNSYNNDRDDSNRYDNGRYNTGRYDDSRYDNSNRYDNGRYDNSRYDNDRYDNSNRYEDSSKYDTSRYDNRRETYKPNRVERHREIRGFNRRYNEDGNVDHGDNSLSGTLEDIFLGNKPERNQGKKKKFKKAK